jgi:hypothetical protein
MIPLSIIHSLTQNILSRLQFRVSSPISDIEAFAQRHSSETSNVVRRIHIRSQAPFSPFAKPDTDFQPTLNRDHSGDVEEKNRNVDESSLPLG